MSTRAKVVIAVILVLLLALLATFVLLRPKAAPPAEVVNRPPATNQNVNSGGLTDGASNPFNANLNAPAVSEPAPVPPVPVDPHVALKNVAKSFAELFGSYSSEGNYQNVVDAEYYMTDSVRAWAEGYVAEQRAKPASGQFFGMTTRAIFDPEVQGFDAALGTATVKVTTRRIETGSSIGAQNVYYQDLLLQMLKVGDTWKVNRFDWGAK